MRDEGEKGEKGVRRWAIAPLLTSELSAELKVEVRNSLW